MTNSRNKLPHNNTIENLNKKNHNTNKTTEQNYDPGEAGQMH